MTSLGWLILVREHGSTERCWKDCGEGPFDTFEQAEAFQSAEIGADHIIVEMATFPRDSNGRLVPFRPI